LLNLGRGRICVCGSAGRRTLGTTREGRPATSGSDSRFLAQKPKLDQMKAILRAIQQSPRFGVHRIFARRRTRKHCQSVVRLVATPRVAINSVALRPASSHVRHTTPVNARYAQHALEVPTITGGKSAKWHGTEQKPSDGSADTAEVRHGRVVAGNAPGVSGSVLRDYASASAAC
jgi:hypothetical protein